jgi:predicted nucleotidyltransferase
MSLLDRYAWLVDRLLAEVKGEYGARLVALAVFGSVGRSTVREDSDVDFLLVARGLPRGRFARVDEFLPAEARVEAACHAIYPEWPAPRLSPVFKSPEELEQGSPLLIDMVEDARILHDPEGILAARLDRLRRRLSELGARRIWRGSAWYWDLKPDLKPGEVFSL